MKTKTNFQKALKLLSKNTNRLLFIESEPAGNMLVTDGHCVLTIPKFEFEFFKESNSKMTFDEMPGLLDIMRYTPEMENIKMTTIETGFDGQKATVFKSKAGKFLSCVNSRFIEMVNLTYYGDCLNYGKSKDRKNPIVYNDGSGCGFVLLPINIDASEILNNVLDFEY